MKYGLGFATLLASTLCHSQIMQQDPLIPTITYLDASPAIHLEWQLPSGEASSIKQHIEIKDQSGHQISWYGYVTNKESISASQERLEIIIDHPPEELNLTLPSCLTSHHCQDGSVSLRLSVPQQYTSSPSVALAENDTKLGTVNGTYSLLNDARKNWGTGVLIMLTLAFSAILAPIICCCQPSSGKREPTTHPHRRSRRL